MIVISGLKRFLKKTLVAYYEALPEYSPTGTEGNHEKFIRIVASLLRCNAGTS
jgi:hypothetical protein